MDAEKLRIARDKLTRVFRYLEALNQHRNPAKRQVREQPWSFWLHDLPEHPSIQRGGAKSVKTKDGNGQATEYGGANYVLKVQRPRLTRPPEPLEEISGWLEDGWDDPSSAVVVKQALEESEISAAPSVVQFTDDPTRVASMDRWKLMRDEWVRTEKPARAAMKIFESLYALYGRIDREAERVELVLGDGILSWRRADGGIYHPILLQRLQVQFDASVPEFTLSESDHPVELYSALFQSMSDVDGRAIGRCREELEVGGFHPLLNGSTSGFLKRLVVQLSPRGEFFEERAPDAEVDDPCIGRDPILFLRARTLGFAAAIEGILADLRTREDLPWSLLNIVGEESSLPEAGVMNPAMAGSVPSDSEVLLSKPANPEQIRIAQQLEQHGGVLVQGPPGTGKTHTIGNLVGHLLAQGKSVLVTSHTTKALRMVRHHIVPELRPLCVSVLESDLDSRKQLESAVGSIAERLSRADVGSLEMQGKKLESERLDLLKKLEEIRNQLTEARADEYRDIAIGGKSWAPADAARRVMQDKETHGWIPGPVAAVAPLPLSPGELADLYRTGVSISREDENELSGHLPELHDLARAEDFEASIGERNQLGMEDLDLRSDLWDSGAAQSSTEEIERLAAALVQAVEPLSGKDKWKLAAVYAGRYGDVHRQPWDQLISFVRLVHREAANAKESFVKYGPEASEKSAVKEQEHIASEILAHLEGGGKLGTFTLFTHKAWSQFLDETTVNKTRPHLPEHFQAL
ncbi:MAG TPA: AAA domain-containing protein, partial [Terriglobales bacterium]|nr:AAA domain-containing protein [Terriglobales bacterium]